VALLAIALWGFPLLAGAQAERGATGHATHLTQVVARYVRLAGSTPGVADNQVALGLAYIAVDDLELAAEAFSRAAAIDPTGYAARYWLGRSQYLRGRYEAAADTLDQLATDAPERHEATSELGLAYFRLHRYPEADERLTRARDLLVGAPPTYEPVSPPPGFAVLDGAWLDRVAPLRLVEVEYYLALSAFEQARFEDAFAHCNASLRAGSSARGYYQRGLSRVRLGRSDEAEADFASAIKSNPDYAQAHYQLALLSFRSGSEAAGRESMERFQALRRSQTAFEEQRKAVLRNADRPGTLTDLGVLYLRSGAHESAAIEFEKALWHDPAYAPALLGAAHAYALVGRLEDALGAHAAATRAESGAPEALAALAFIRLEQAKASQDEGDYRAAAELHREVVTLQPDGAEGWLRLGQIARRLGDLTEARAALDAWLALPHADETTLVQVHMALGDICLRQNDMAAAERHYREVLRRDSRVAEAYFNMGYVATALGRVAQAAWFYEAALEIDPSLTESHHLVGALYVRLERHDDAKAAYLRAIESDATAGGPHERLAHLLATLGEDLEGARRHAEAAVALDPGSAEYLNTLSWVHYLSGNHVEAETTLLRALEGDPDNAAYRDGLDVIRRAAKGER
jgi:tetratricopeptide (TPR) repeat protein